MIIAIANVNILLPCLATLCTLLILGIATVSLLFVLRKRKNSKIMQQDVYRGECDILNVDYDVNNDKQLNCLQNAEGGCNEDKQS